MMTFNGEQTDMIPYLYTYTDKAESALALAKALKAVVLTKRTYPKLINLRQPEALIINWGASTLDRSLRLYDVVNHPDNVARAVDKRLAFLRLMKFVPTPTVLFNPEAAREYRTKNPNASIVCRSVVDGFDGQGITIVPPGAALPNCPMYTVFEPDCTEYRVTVAFGKVVGVQHKVRMSKRPPGGYNDRIKTTGNGYGLNLVELGSLKRTTVEAVAVNAVGCMGLDFAGVDVLLPKKGLRGMVLEVNTAPQLTPAILARTAEAFREALGLA